MVVVDGRAVKILHVHGCPLVGLQLACKATALLQRMRKLFIHPVVVQQRSGLVAHFLEVGEHITLRIDALVQLFVRCLSAGAVQYPQRGRPAVAGGTVEVCEQHIKALEERVVSLTYKVHVVPREGTDMQQDDVERGWSVGRGELNAPLAFAGIKALQQGVW